MRKVKLMLAALGFTAAMAAAPLRANWDDPDKKADKMISKLELSGDRAERFRRAWDEKMSALRPLKERVKNDIEELRRLVDRRASDSDLKDALDKLERDMKALHNEKMDQKEKVMDTLTVRQQAQLCLEMDEKMMKHMGGKSWDKDYDNDDRERPTERP